MSRLNKNDINMGGLLYTMSMSDLSKCTKAELLEKCTELCITKCKSKTKAVLIVLIRQHTQLHSIM